MKGSGASLSSKGPLSRVCRESFLIKKKEFKRNSVWHNFSGFLRTSIYHEQCPFAACFTWISLGCSPAVSHLLSCSSLNYKYLELGKCDLVDL